MSDAFEEIQAIKIKRNSLREKLQKRKRERHELFTLTSATPVSTTLTNESPVSTGNYISFLFFYFNVYLHTQDANSNRALK